MLILLAISPLAVLPRPLVFFGGSGGLEPLDWKSLSDLLRPRVTRVFLKIVDFFIENVKKIVQMVKIK